jgi:hypothetical protein
MSEYRYLRLVSGESVVSNVENVEGDKTVIRLKLPLQVVLNRDYGLVMFPFLPIASSDDRDITIKKDHVLFTCSLIAKVADLLTKYTEKAYNPEPPKEEEKSEEQKKLPANNLSELLEQLDQEITSGKKPS